MIKVNDRFYINADTNCYKLQEKTIIQDKESKNYGQEFFKDLGYYTTLEGCLRGILKTNIREYIGKESENSLKELQSEVKRVSEFLTNLKLDILDI